MKPASHALLASLLLLFAWLPVSLRAQAEEETNKALPTLSNEHHPARDAKEEQAWIHAGARTAENLPSHSEKNKTLIALVSVIVVFATPVIIVALYFSFRHRQLRMMHDTIRGMVEKGVPIPPELLAGGGAAHRAALPARSRNDLRSGLVLLAVGIGVTVLVGRPGLIPLFIGVALLVCWAIGKIGTSSKPPQ